jgi:1-deoxy-D-xylulose-5-phosphate synthase
MVRYPRGASIGADITSSLDIEFGKSKLISKGQKVAILNFGTLLPIANKVAEKYNATVIDMRFVKPLDEKAIEDVCKNHSVVITIEENSVAGGAGSAVNEYILANDLQKNISLRNFGLQDAFLNHGTKDLLLEDSSLSVDKISKVLDKILG